MPNAPKKETRIVLVGHNLRAERPDCLLDPQSPGEAQRIERRSDGRVQVSDGVFNTIKNNLETITLFANSTSPEPKEFNAISKADVLPVALNWRDARFKALGD